jgi:hypothetical protein
MSSFGERGGWGLEGGCGGCLGFFWVVLDVFSSSKWVLVMFPKMFSIATWFVPLAVFSFYVWSKSIYIVESRRLQNFFNYRPINEAH